MSRPRHHHSAWQVYADVLMCVLMAFVMMLATLLLEPIVTKAQQDGAKPKAEYLITLSWDDTRDVDLDLWLRDPNGHLIGYANREVPNISLDRDSRGFSTNKTALPNGQVVNSGNQEIISIRAIMPGDYIAAVNYYTGVGGPIYCKVIVQKVNPAVTTVDSAMSCHLDTIKESMNEVAFHIDLDGSVTVLPVPPGDIIHN